MSCNYKSLVTGVVAGALAVSLCSAAFARAEKVMKELEYRNIKVSLDGKVLDLRDVQGNSVEPFMFDGTNYLPVRALAESLGLAVAWDGPNTTVVLTTPDDSKPVYVTRTEEYYHYDADCNDGKYWNIPYSSAVGMGLLPCSQCVLKNDSATQPDDNTNPEPSAPVSSDTSAVPDYNRTIYITPTGKKYHFDSSCNGGTYQSSTLEQAIALGLEPCQKCVMN